MFLVFYYIWDFFTAVFNMISAVSKWILAVIGLLTSSVGFLIKIIGVLPTAFTISFVALVAVAVIYKILGREGQD